MDAIAEKYIKMVGLEKFIDSYPKELSGGMKQRVAIARLMPLILLFFLWMSLWCSGCPDKNTASDRVVKDMAGREQDMFLCYP